MEGQRWENENEAFMVNFLQFLVIRCKKSLKITTKVKFITMINMLHLIAKIIKYIFILSLPTSINKMNHFSLK